MLNRLLDYTRLILGFSTPRSQREQQLTTALRTALRLLAIRDLTHYIILDYDLNTLLFTLWISILTTIPNTTPVLPPTALPLHTIQHTFTTVLTLLLWTPILFSTLWAYLRTDLTPRESYRRASVLLWISLYIPLQFYNHFFIYPWLDVNLVLTYDADLPDLPDISASPALSTNPLLPPTTTLLTDYTEPLGHDGQTAAPLYIIDIYTTSIHAFTTSITLAAIYLFNWVSLGDSLRHPSERGAIDIDNPDVLWLSDAHTPPESSYTLEYTFLNAIASVFIATSVLNWIDLFLLLQLATLTAMLLYRRRPVLSRLLHANIYHLGESVLWAYLLIQITITLLLPTPLVLL